MPAVGAIQVKNVPEDLHDELRRRAAAEGVDLQAYLLRILRREVGRPSAEQWWAELRARPLVHGTPPAADTLAEERGARP